jgi:hypothetical protein
MERGPLALFGAILAVGVGPALWLGAQLGAVDLAPGQRPAPVDEQFPGVEMDFGGAGAGEMPADEPLTTYTFSPLVSATSAATPKPAAVASADPIPARPSPPSPPPPSPSPSLSPEPSTSSAPSGSPSASTESSASAGPGPSGTPSGSPEPSTAGPTPGT